MRAAFRLDASKEIGAGHAMRCLSLASALKRRGAATRFVCRHVSPSLSAQIRHAGHELVMLAPAPDAEEPDELPQSHLLGTSQRQDVTDSLGALAGPRWDLLVVDHYALDARWETAMRAVANRIMAIDDAADRAHECDLLLDQNLFADMETRYARLVPATARQLLGPRYAMLRPEFEALHERAAHRSGEVRRVFVLFGGVDPYDLTSRALQAIARIPAPLVADVVIGAEHPRRVQIESACAAAGHECHVQTGRIAELMSRADLALGAGGSASWERCCVGLPTICVAFADNQYPIARALHDAGACVFLGDPAQSTADGFAASMADLISAPDRLRDMSARAGALVDGRGVERVCETICH